MVEVVGECGKRQVGMDIEVAVEVCLREVPPGVDPKSLHAISIATKDVEQTVRTGIELQADPATAATEVAHIPGTTKLGQ